MTPVKIYFLTDSADCSLTTDLFDSFESFRDELAEIAERSLGEPYKVLETFEAAKGLIKILNIDNVDHCYAIGFKHFEVQL